LGIVSVAAVFLSIYIGYRFMTADGDEKRREAKSQLIYAIIGVIVAVALTALMNSIDLASMLSTNPSTSTSTDSS
jgi:multisubunit Na+/H+ antiporter MnhB subunit